MSHSRRCQYRSTSHQHQSSLSTWPWMWTVKHGWYHPAQSHCALVCVCVLVRIYVCSCGGAWIVKMSPCFCVHMCSCGLVYKTVTLVMHVNSEIRAAGRACNQEIIYSSYEEFLFIFNSLFLMPLYNWHEQKHLWVDWMFGYYNSICLPLGLR